jgi:hypothetical protein
VVGSLVRSLVECGLQRRVDEIRPRCRFVSVRLISGRGLLSVHPVLALTGISELGVRRVGRIRGALVRDARAGCVRDGEGVEVKPYVQASPRIEVMRSCCRP